MKTKEKFYLFKSENIELYKETLLDNNYDEEKAEQAFFKLFHESKKRETPFVQWLYVNENLIGEYFFTARAALGHLWSNPKGILIFLEDGISVKMKHHKLVGYTIAKEMYEEYCKRNNITITFSPL